MDTEYVPDHMAYLLGHISIRARLELDGTGLLHATPASYLHEDALIRVSVSKHTDLMHLLM
jgi:hypothetical protein